MPSPVIATTWPRSPQSNHHVLLLLRRHTTENIVSSRSLSEASDRPQAESKHQPHPQTLSMPAVFAAAATVNGFITREDLQSHTLTVEILHILGASARTFSRKITEQNRGSIRRDLLDRLILLVANHRRSMRQNHRAQTQRRQFGGTLTRSAVPLAKRLRSAQKPRTRILKLNRTKTQSRGERHNTAHRRRRSIRETTGQSRSGRVRVLIVTKPRQRLIPAGRREARQDVLRRVSIRASASATVSSGRTRIQNHATLSQGAGLIEAGHIHTRQNLNRRLFLHQDVG